MKSNEVRVGNFILFSGVKTKVIPQDFATQCRGINSSEMPNFEPIPINEDWFLKFGFKQITTNEDWFVIPLKDRSLAVSTYGNVEISSWDRLMISHGCICEYVHQLQNLYFAITGVELVSSTEP